MIKEAITSAESLGIPIVVTVGKNKVPVYTKHYSRMAGKPFNFRLSELMSLRPAKSRTSQRENYKTFSSSLSTDNQDFELGVRVFLLYNIKKDTLDIYIWPQHILHGQIAPALEKKLDIPFKTLLEKNVKIDKKIDSAFLFALSSLATGPLMSNYSKPILQAFGQLIIEYRLTDVFDVKLA